MKSETMETRMARMEEAMVSVKGDTMYLRRGFDGFKEQYWKELIKLSAKVAGVAAVTSLFVGLITAVAAKVVLK